MTVRTPETNLSETDVACRYVSELSRRLVAVPDDQILDAAVKAVCDISGASMALVSRVFSTEQPVYAYAIHDRVGGATEYSYPLRGTPCEQVFQDRQPLVRTGGVQDEFPEDTDLQQMSLNAYAGIPLEAEASECMGLMAVLWQETPEHPDATVEMLKAIEPRIVAGVRRVDEEKRLAHSLEYELDEHQSRMDIALNFSAIGVWDFNIETGQLVWDSRMFALYGIEPAHEDLTYATWVNALHPEDSVAAEAAVSEAIANQTQFDTRFRICLPDGSIRWIRGAGQVVASRRGQVKLIGCNWDVTRDVELQNLLEAQKESAEAANEAKSQFLANMSHEIRTPLNGILGMAQLLKRSELNERQRYFANTISASGDILLALVSDVLDLARIEAGSLSLDRAPFCLSDVLQSVCDTLTAPARDKNLKLVVDAELDGEDRRVGDAKRLHQVLLNLVGNAVKFTEAGSVTLRVCSLENAVLRIEVQDTGPGIHPDRQAHLFDRFTQLDSSNTRVHGGAGLGLAISRELVTLAGGFIGVESTPGEGAKFWVELEMPLAADCETVTTEDETASRKGVRPDLEGVSILIAEDVEHNRNVFIEALREQGCTPVCAADGEEALAKWRDGHFDALLVDLHMPGVSGDDVIRQIRGEAGAGPKVPIFAVTADASAATHEEMIRLGADGCFTKPVDLDKLIDGLKLHLQPVERV